MGKNYIDKQEMRNELIKLKDTDIVSEKLHMMFWEMANRIAKKPRFFSYTWKEDMIVTAYLRCIKYAKVFDTNRDNPFGYFSTAIHNCYFKFRNDEMKYQNKKWVELSNHIIEMEHKHNIIVDLNEDIKYKVYTADAKK